ncbi:hypothetical protein Poli38472_007489 [Pythium oligandrum]|uniref:FYVE-type domain-containing protein n=1 Tax=Pythium oligandrum TaxID=41045 RepID=A0A8K1FQC9_PYTOL|nr:hypothetical protein Poli38472_007489 [Pythium oligandrum]|eukprot:TMW67817.1 hypothetical protein Poli38472_007489 [Pythium oligandrum]
MPASTMASHIPVPAELPPLTEEQKEEFIYEANNAYAELFHSVQVARTKTSSGGTHLEGVSEETGSTVWLCTTTTLHGTLEEVAELYLSSDCHFILDFAQSKRLYELESPSETHPLRCTAVRWSRWTAIASVIRDRDFVYLECMDSFEDQTTGNRGWARVSKSIELDSCPPSKKPDGPRRGELLVSGKILRETGRPGVLEAITLVNVDVKRVVPGWVRKTALKTRKLNALNMNHLLKIRRLLKAKTATGKQKSALLRGPRSDIDRRTCYGCREHISRWKRVYTCRECSEVICPQCAAISYYDSTFHELKNRICVDCSVVDPQQSIMEAVRELEHRQEEEITTPVGFVPHKVDDDRRFRTLSSISHDSDDWNDVQNELSMSRVKNVFHGPTPVGRSVSYSRASEALSHSRVHPDRPAAQLRATALETRAAPPSHEPVLFDLSYLQNYAAPKPATHTRTLL